MDGGKEKNLFCLIPFDLFYFVFGSLDEGTKKANYILVRLFFYDCSNLNRTKEKKQEIRKKNYLIFVELFSGKGSLVVSLISYALFKRGFVVVVIASLFVHGLWKGRFFFHLQNNEGTNK